MHEQIKPQDEIAQARMWSVLEHVSDAVTFHRTPREATQYIDRKWPGARPAFVQFGRYPILLGAMEVGELRFPEAPSEAQVKEGERFAKTLY